MRIKEEKPMNRKIKNDKKRNRIKNKGQVALEFTFCFIVLLILVYGGLKAVEWVGKSYGGRQKDHETILTLPCGPDDCESATFLRDTPLKQVNPDFGDFRDMDIAIDVE